MNESTYITITLILGFAPVLYYLLFFPKEKTIRLRNNSFGGWYFIFELSSFFTIGFIPAIVINTLFFSDSWPIRDKIPVIFIISTAAYFTYLPITWLKKSGYRYNTKLHDLKPFIREISGKDPYPNSSNPKTSSFRPKWQFIGCGLSLFIMAAAFVILLWLWVNS